MQCKRRYKSKSIFQPRRLRPSVITRPRQYVTYHLYLHTGKIKYKYATIVLICLCVTTVTKKIQN